MIFTIGETMDEAAWRKAEHRHPLRTYVEPELQPLHRDTAGRWAIACLLGAAVVLGMMVWTARPGPAFAVCGGCYGSTPASRAEARERASDQLGSQGANGFYSNPGSPSKKVSGGSIGGKTPNYSNGEIGNPANR